jgi:hypothetical protein
LRRMGSCDLLFGAFQRLHEGVAFGGHFFEGGWIGPNWLSHILLKSTARAGRNAGITDSMMGEHCRQRAYELQPYGFASYLSFHPCVSVALLKRYG